MFHNYKFDVTIKTKTSPFFHVTQLQKTDKKYIDDRIIQILRNWRSLDWFKYKKSATMKCSKTVI